MDHSLPELQYTRYYRTWHDGSRKHFDEMAKYFSEKLSPILADLERDARNFEVGCGGGFALGGLNLLGFQNVIGCDSDGGQVADATRFGVNAVRVSAEEFQDYIASIQKDGFDAILIFDVLEHIPVAEQRAFLFRLRNALRDGGRLVCQVPNANALVASRFRYGDWTHSSSFTEQSLDFVLFNSGFDNINITESDAPKFPPFGPRWVKSLPLWALRVFFRAVRRLQFAAEGGRLFASAPLTPNIIALARKGNLEEAS